MTIRRNHEAQCLCNKKNPVSGLIRRLLSCLKYSRNDHLLWSQSARFLKKKKNVESYDPSLPDSAAHRNFVEV